MKKCMEGEHYVQGECYVEKTINNYFYGIYGKELDGNSLQ